jgi:hypothetical protein
VWRCVFRTVDLVEEEVEEDSRPRSKTKKEKKKQQHSVSEIDLCVCGVRVCNTRGLLHRPSVRVPTTTTTKELYKNTTKRVEFGFEKKGIFFRR